jgi:hypothetical protein
MIAVELLVATAAVYGGIGLIGDTIGMRPDWLDGTLAVMQRYFVLQPVLLGLGLLVMVLALWAARHRPLLPAARTGRTEGRTTR